jgi:hypothetical protein
MRPVRFPAVDRRLLSSIVIVLGLIRFSSEAHAQSPELSMREFSSGQIKKGVRSIGFGGDGATWGNYGLVYRDAATALADVGVTDYTNGTCSPSPRSVPRHHRSGAGWLSTSSRSRSTPRMYICRCRHRASDRDRELSSEAAPIRPFSPRSLCRSGTDFRRAFSSPMSCPSSTQLRQVAIRHHVPFTTRLSGGRPVDLASCGSQFPGSWLAPA